MLIYTPEMIVYANEERLQRALRQPSSKVCRPRRRRLLRDIAGNLLVAVGARLRGTARLNLKPQ